MTPTPQQLHILRHSLGFDDAGYPKGGAKGSYRNHYIYPPTPILDALCAAGLMRNDGSNAATGDMNCYRVTPTGEKVVEEHAPKRPRFTEAQQRYQDFLSFDGGMNFIEYLRWRTARHKRERRA